MTNLWVGGEDAYWEALSKEYHAERDKLRTQLKSAKTESEQQELVQQIARLTETYWEKLRAIPRSLF